jgi:predicted transcriptional regulator
MMYTAFVPHEQMTELVDLLLNNDLLTFDQQKHLYHMTTKGGKFLVCYNNMLDCLVTY